MFLQSRESPWVGAVSQGWEGEMWFQLNAKRIADVITAARAAIGIIFPWMGWAHGVASLPTAVWLMLVDWTGDAMDGTIARHSQPVYHTWLGDHDLEVDILVALGLLGYMVFAGFVTPALAGLYVIFWILVLWLWHVPRALGMLCQTPIYGWFILMAVQNAPQAGKWLLTWIIVAIIVTWPRFPQEVVPNFLAGMRRLLK